MTSPQSPDVRRSDLGSTTQEGLEAPLGARGGPGEGGRTGPTPPENQTEDERHSGESTTLRTTPDAGEDADLEGGSA
ncbi:MAG TPA: hypothetical protein VHB69_02225 [Mycobacteriales bacterium]|jgi:hypothetical protein|nr:hypothetical protein [Mycobacteriales bacterium]